MFAKQKNLLSAWGCALLTLLCVLATHPIAEIGINDDWSYIFTAKRLAETGHIFYNGWAAPILVPQLYLGALFIKLFDFSFTAVRASSIVVFLLSTVLAHAILTRAGIRTLHATLGTLTLVLSPLFLPIATTYMSDTFAMFFILIFFYACLRANEAATNRTTNLWLVLATAAGLAAGSVRQIGFLCTLVSLPALAAFYWQRPKLRTACAALWIASTACVLLILHWFSKQDYVAVEKPLNLPHSSLELHHLFAHLFSSFVTCLFLISPVLFAIATQARWRKRAYALLLFCGLTVVVSIITRHFGGIWWGRWLIGHYVNGYGGVWRPMMHMLGPDVQTVPGWLAATAALFVIVTSAFAGWALWSSQSAPATGHTRDTNRLLLAIGISFTAAYLLLVFTRAFVYDRYFLPLLFLAILGLLRWLEQRPTGKATALAFLPLAVIAGYGIAGTHDMFLAGRAVTQATAELRAAAIPRTQIQDGWSYDGWTQIEATGYVNEPRLRPSTAYQPIEVPAWLDHTHPATDATQTCTPAFFTYAPSIHARYVLQSAPNYCFPDSTFAPVKFRTWLPPYAAEIHIATLPQFAQ